MTPEEVARYVFALAEKAFNDRNFQLKKACEKAHEAARKQVPMKPILEKKQYCEAYYCPACDWGITMKDGLLGTDGWNLFCNHCGQALDWEGLDD